MKDNENDSSEASGKESWSKQRSRPSDPDSLANIDLAYIDDLTGLGNRRFVNNLLHEDWQKLAERSGEISVIVIDLDGFKGVNDTYGHAAGDRVLQEVGKLLRKQFREGDFVARHGGDEYFILLPGAKKTMASQFAVRARRAVDTASFTTAEGKSIGVPLSFSMGIASFPEDGSNGAAVMEAADRQLYAEKRQRSQRKNPRVFAGIAIVVILLILALLSTFWFRKSSGSAEGPVRRSVAVLGFKNLSGRTEAAWLSTAFSEMISTDLAAGGTIRVIPGESVARARNDIGFIESEALASDTLRQVHTRLGSDVFVVGSYLEVPGQDGQIRLDVRLQDASGGEIGVVSETGKTKDLLDLVAKTSAKLRQVLGVPPLPADTTAAVNASQPATTDATRLYAEGLDHLRKFDALKARDLLQRATQADPNWPLAYSALAEAWMTLGYDARARESAHRAYELSRALPREERLLVEGRYHETATQWKEAIRVYDRLHRFAPDNLEYGLALARAQRLSGSDSAARETLATLRELPNALSSDPRIDLMEAETAQDFMKTRDAARRAGEQARAQGARLFLARAKVLEAWALGEMGQYEEASIAAEEGRQIYARAGDKGGLARAINRLATVRPNQADLIETRKLYEESARLSREVGDRKWLPMVLNNLAITYSDTGDLATARPIYEEALAIAREVDARRQITIVVNNLGRDMNSIGNPLEGRRLLKEALEGYRSLGDYGSEVYALNNLGNSALMLGELDVAQKLYEEGLAITTKSGEQRIRAYTFLDLGDVQYFRGDLAGAREWYEQCMELRRKINVRLDIADTQLVLTRLALAENDPKKAEALATEAVDVFRKEKSATEFWARALQAQALLDQKRIDEASTVLAPALAAAEKMQLAQFRLAVRTIQGRVLAAKGDTQKAIRILEAALEDAMRKSLVPETFDLQLALLEVKRTIPASRDAAIRGFKALEENAKKRGFGLFVQKAHAAAKS